MIDEDTIQRHIVKLLESYARPDVVWFAVPNGGFRFGRTAAILKAQGLRPGAPDLVILRKGEFHGVEIKSDKGVVSGHQAAFGLAIEQAGGGYHVTYGLDQTIKRLIALDIFRPGLKFTFPEAKPSKKAKTQ